MKKIEYEIVICPLCKQERRVPKEPKSATVMPTYLPHTHKGEGHNQVPREHRDAKSHESK